MKKLIILILVLAFSAILMAKEAKLGNSKHGYSILEENSNYMIIEYGITSLNYDVFSNNDGEFTDLRIENGYLTRDVGKPALPTFRNLIEVPYGAQPEIEVLSFDEEKYTLSDLGITKKIAPAQPSYSKSSNPEDIKFVYDPQSYQSGYSKRQLAETYLSGTMRGVGIGSVVVNPIDYDAASGTIKVYQRLKVKVNFIGKADNSDEIKMESYSPFFDQSFRSLINYKEVDNKADLAIYPASYLIVASDQFQYNAKLNEFIAWKKQKGFNVVTNYVSSSTTISTIDSWIENQWNNLSPKPSFVLIVGDESGTYTVKTEVNPPLGSGGSVTRSDLLYGVIGSTSSSNRIPSMYVGRFSAQSVADLEAQIDKTMWYEKGQFEDNYNLDYLKNVMGVAGADASYQATYGNPQIRYGMTYYFNDTYVNPVTGTTNGINGIAYYDGASGQASNIINKVSDGLAFYNYTAHGSQTSFGDPSFTVSNVNSLTNANEYGLIIGNCCLTGSFGTTECFGESWLNAPNKGAIGYIGASMSTYWDEDLAFGVGEAATGNITPAYSPNKPGSYDGIMRRDYPTQAGMRHVGLLAVETYGGSKVDWYWSSYHLFGDPSLMVYMGVPSTMTVSHGTLSSTATSFTVNTTPKAYVAISDANGTLHGAALANSSGVATINLTPVTTSTAKLVAYAQFKKPVFETITVGGGSGNNPPTCAITSPANNSVYNIGDDVA
ncbi:MAG: hypothetical protein JW870_16010, partial [Candidatus Delongbacteria bacterium]|nr:hypothetical protein [Candidatus Delongbacteria bacterium]